MGLVSKSSFAAAAIILTVMIGPSPASRAHDGATGIVKERMDAMKDISAAMKVIFETIKGERETPPADLRQAALTINALAGDTLNHLFPEGSLHHPSEAKADIWQDWSRFEKLSADLELYSASYADDLDKDSVMKMAGTCRDCHQAFRVKK